MIDSDVADKMVGWILMSGEPRDFFIG